MGATNNNNAEITVTLQKNFVQESYGLMLAVIFSQLAFIASLVWYLCLQIQNLPEPLYFFTTKNEQIIHPVPLEEPAVTTPYVLNLVNEVVNSAYTFNYRNIQHQLKLIKEYFDDRGQQSFFAFLSSDPFMKDVIKERLVVSATVMKAPQILVEGLFEGRYSWRIMLPIVVVYQNDLASKKRELELECIVWRVPETESPNKLKITYISGKSKREIQMNKRSQRKT